MGETLSCTKGLTMKKVDRNESITGCILGTAVGDALGLPYEGLSPARAEKMLGVPDSFRLLPSRGMVSDDTEHTCMVAQALLTANGDVQKFERHFAWRLRLWLLLLPVGTGFATLRAIIKLWLGFSPENSGVFSAGNGPAMRAPIFGACFDDLELMRQYVKASTRITHSDPKAEFGALAIALAAFMAKSHDHVEPEEFCSSLEKFLPADATEMLSLVRSAAESVTRCETTRQFAADRGLRKGVSGYIYHTVPVVLHCWLRHQNNFKAAVVEIIECGGDADTTAAIVGGIIGAGVGKMGIPAEMLAGLCEWPATVSWMESLGMALAQAGNKDIQPVAELRFWKILPRNLFLLIVVLLHGFRRIFPPY